MAITDIYNSVLTFDGNSVARLVQAELQTSTDVSQILKKGLIGAMDEVGRRFSAGELFVPEMLVAAMAMKSGLEILRPYLTEKDSKQRGLVVIGTVKGDLHDIGKNLVAMMLEGAGFRVIDLGVGVDVDRFLFTADETQANIVAISALLTTTMPAMESIVAAIKKEGLVVRTMIGGAPVTQAFCDKIGADGYGQDAAAAVDLARRLVPE